MIFYIRGHEHARVVHIGNADAREERVGHEDDFEVLPTSCKEHRLGTNQLEGRVP